MLNLASIAKIYPSLTPKKKAPVKRKRGTIASQLPVSKETITKVVTALKSGDWVTFKELCDVTGFTRGTIGRAGKMLCKDKVTVGKVDKTGRARNNYLRLVA